MPNEMFSISKLLDEYVVHVPEIQRDYAQGRDNQNAEMVRNKLLDDICDVLSGKKGQHVLNYIYGVPQKEVANDEEIIKLILIDGQQRVTTLFLIKWYLAVKGDLNTAFLTRLVYATRDSSEEFCGFLSEYGTCIKEDNKPSVLIENHIKFKKRWLHDPTIVNMLNMLDAIHNHFVDKAINPELLDNVKFSFVSLDGFKRVDELYAAMNSRGKQLTPFELIKGELLKKYSNLASIINGYWLPWFWKISKTYAPNDQDQEQYASEYHDQYLYNYYSYIVQMIWWRSETAKTITKGKSLPTVLEMTREIYEMPEAIELIRFAMSLVEETFISYDFSELVRFDDKSYETITDKIILFDGRPSDSVNFFKLCCEGTDFTQAGKCYLWAFIRYKYDEKNNAIGNNRTLLDYYLLMRSLYMLKASNDTPTSVDKLSLNEEQIGSVIIPFENILSGNQADDAATQKEVFYSDNPNKYKILNNPLVRGATDNIGTQYNDILVENLDWIYNSNELTCFKRLSSCGFTSFICPRSGYYTRPFIPCKKKMLQSLFSIRGWIYSDTYKSFLEYIKENRLEEQTDKEYSFSDWEYYFIKYESFRAGKYGQFDAPDGQMFNSTFIENERATKNKAHNPFVYEVYLQKKKDDESYDDYANKLSFVQNETGNYEWKYEDENYNMDMTRDFIDEMVQRI